MQVVIIALEFPPLNTAGSVRPFRMAEEMGLQGIQVTVFTISKSKSHGLFHKPNNLELSSSKFTTIEIVPTNPEQNKRSKLRSWISVERDFYYDVWYSDVFNAMQEFVFNNGKPDWIIGTCPPFSTARVTREISHSLDIPFVLDLRDAWSQWNISPATSWIHYRATLREEGRSLHSAFMTLTTSEQTKKDLSNLHGKETSIHTIENGYDVNIQFPRQISWDLKEKKPITIGYVGSFYYTPEAHKRMHSKWHQRSPHRWMHYSPRKEDWTYRSPKYFFKILQELFNIDNTWKDRIQIAFVGSVPYWLQNMIHKYDLETITKCHGQVSLKRSLELQKEFDFFLGTSAMIEGQPDYSMGSKYFEALQFLKPIIAVCGESPLSELTTQGNIGIVLDPNSPKESSKRLKEFFEKKEISPNIDYLETKSRKHQVNKLIDLLRN